MPVVHTSARYGSMLVRFACSSSVGLSLVGNCKCKRTANTVGAVVSALEITALAFNEAAAMMAILALGT